MHNLFMKKIKKRNFYIDFVLIRNFKNEQFRKL